MNFVPRPPFAKGVAVRLDETATDEPNEGERVATTQHDPAAFDALYQLYYRRVYRYLRTHTGSDEDAADATQQVFLQALEALPRYSERGLPFAAWLFRIARNVATDRYRRRRNFLPWQQLSEAQHPPSSDNLEAFALRQEARVELAQMLSQLSADKRELLALRFGGDLTLAEIGQVVGKSEGAVKKQITRTLAVLRQQYARKNDTGGFLS